MKGKTRISLHVTFLVCLVDNSLFKAELYGKGTGLIVTIRIGTWGSREMLSS